MLFRSLALPPVLVTPADNANVDTSSPKFSWKDVAGASSYDYLVWDEARGWLDSFTTQLSFTPATPLPNGTYYWKIRAKNNYGEGPWSATRTLNINSSVLPAPTLATPANNATLRGGDISFSWSSVVNAHKYNLQIADSSSFRSALVDTSIRVSQYVVNLMEGEGYGRVRATDVALNSGPWSTVWKVSVSAAKPPTEKPSKPTLGSPADGSTVTTKAVTLKWNSAKGAERYYLEVAENDSFEEKYVEVDLTSTTYTIPEAVILPKGELVWNVRAANTMGFGPWSNVWSFKYNPRVGQPPPSNGKPPPDKGKPPSTLLDFLMLLLPMSPSEGPPLPKGLAITWERIGVKK